MLLRNPKFNIFTNINNCEFYRHLYVFLVVPPITYAYMTSRGHGNLFIRNKFYGI